MRMRVTFYRLLLTTFLALLLSCGAAVSIPEQLPLSPTLSLRNATVSDAEVITNILLAAFHDSPHMKYVYQFMDKHPRDHHDCLYKTIYQAFSLPGVLIQLALLPDIAKPHQRTPVAAAVWVLPTAWRSGLGGDPDFSLSCPLLLAKCEHRDLNLTRATDFNHQVTVAKEKYLNKVYARQAQMYLDSLATHPDYQRRGAGGALVRSGVAIGMESYEGENITATLIATEAGEPLYTHLGWQSMHNFTVQSLDVANGTRESWRFDVMKHEL